MHVTKHRALALFTVLALAACSGKDGTVGAKGDKGDAGAAGVNGTNGAAGTNGVNGTNGTNGVNGTNGKDLTAVAQPESCEICHRDAGTEHQSIYNAWVKGLSPSTSALAVTVDSVVSTVDSAAGVTPVTYKSVVTFTLKKNGQPVTDLLTLPYQQKTIYASQWDAATKTVPTATSFSFGGWAATATPGQYTAFKAGVKFAPEQDASAFVYGYFGDSLVLPVKGHYNLMNNMISFSKTYGTAISFTSTANVTGCEKCHQAPYSKHGYRQAVVAGLPDFVACKVCHTAARVGSDFDWQVIADDPALYASEIAAGTFPTTADKAKYAYTANVMNDTHMSHAMEFEYPQSMANCATCHEGKLNNILTDANFKLSTCKSCHPVTGPATIPAGRAPALKTLLQTGSLALIHTMDLNTYTGDCNTCHGPSGIGRVFNKIHTGYNAQIYKADGTKYSATIAANITTATFDSATNKLTVNFTMAGTAANAIVKPTVVASLYAYGTKDFVISGHSSQPAPDSKRNLEWAEGASGNSPRLAVTPATATAGNTSWTAVADLTTWASLITSGQVKRVEIGVLPVLGLDQTKAVATDNPAIAVKGVSKTFDLVAKALVADGSAYGRAIVDSNKCNNCHDALGTTFHSPSYGSAGTVACRLCHTVASGGSHLEQQSRSIDSYVHAIHSFQPFDVSGIKFKSDPVAALWYDLKIEATYPNFSILNCASCHNPGTYEVPDQTKSLPSVLSASANIPAAEFPSFRTIGTVPSVVVGPGSRACGSCHRSQMINENDAAKLSAFDSHTAAFSTQLLNTTQPAGSPSVFEAAITTIFSWFK